MHKVSVVGGARRSAFGPEKEYLVRLRQKIKWLRLKFPSAGVWSLSQTFFLLSPRPEFHYFNTLWCSWELPISKNSWELKARRGQSQMFSVRGPLREAKSPCPNCCYCNHSPFPSPASTVLQLVAKLMLLWGISRSWCVFFISIRKLVTYARNWSLGSVKL